ncbi:MAG: two-component system NtrC family sensor kinase [Candidatus Promineifilaceae bacterium]|jgi:two-component system NtrC family sensor kinase
MLAIMGLITFIMVYTTKDLIRRQLDREATQILSQSLRAMDHFMNFRAQEMLLRTSTAANDPRFKSVAQLGDANTMQVMLKDLSAEFELSFIHYLLPSGVSLAGTANENMRPLSKPDMASDIVSAAAQGTPSTEVVIIQERIFDVAAIPVDLNGSVQGVLLVGLELADQTARELGQLTGCQVVILNDHAEAASSMDPRISQHKLLEVIDAVADVGAHISTRLNNETYLITTGKIAGARDTNAAFLLLYSYQDQIEQLAATQTKLTLIGLAGTLLSGLLAWLIILRLTRPLKDLQLAVEALGEQDFSHRVPETSKDEFGNFARSFNEMVERLEQTIGTLSETKVRLAHTEKLSSVGEFIAGIAHELNNPLTVMVAYAELLEASDLDPAHHKEIQLISESAMRCCNIVQNLLSFSRQRQPEKSNIDVRELLNGTLQFMGYELRTSGIEIEEITPASLPDILGDPNQLQQVFLNIVNNARQALEDVGTGGHLTIETLTAGGRVIIKIEDDGPGIRPKNLDKLFDPFFTTKDVGKGTGLGLSVSYGIIKEHGGDIKAHSALGVGTTFIIDLPAYVPPVANSATPENTNEPAQRRSFKGYRSLVIDDEVDVRTATQRALASFGLLADAANSGEDALLHINQHTYDIILCDWKMPDMNGRELFTRLQKTNIESTLHFVFYTGDVLNKSAMRFIEDCGLDHLSKPFTREELYRLLCKRIPNAQP